MDRAKSSAYFFHLQIKAVVSFVLFVSSVCFSNVQMPSIFCDNMVIQQGMEVPVWGKAEPGEEINVSFKGQSLDITADVNGDWMVKLSSLTADSNASQMIVDGNNIITFDNVLVGEVWVCSGQSNMVFQLQNSDNGASAITDSGNYNMRLFQTDGINTTVWKVCDPTTSPVFSAVAFYFGRQLAKNLDVPIGLIQIAVGSTSARRWTVWDEGSGDLYYERIVPIQPFAIRGVIWYQGEADAKTFDEALTYRNLFPTLIYNWRRDWHQGNFPFLFVQLAQYETDRVPGWMMIREAQMMSLSEPDTAMACIIDIETVPKTNIHPTHKLTVGLRLALAARKIAYGEDIVYQGPIYDSETSYVDNNAVVIGFTHIGTGLDINDTNGTLLEGFEIIGENGVFVDADAQIIGDTVVVSSPLIQKPRAVRYGWDGYPQCNLFNAEGLPASPFRTMPDLTILGSPEVSPASVSQGGTIQVDWTEKNIGAPLASSPAHHTKIFLSTSAYGATYQLAYCGPMNTLAVGATHSYSEPALVVPASVPVGDYYVTVFIDCDEQVAEANEDNNIGSSSPTRVTIALPCGGRYYPVGDISGPQGQPDCYVDMYDLMTLAAQWLNCNDPKNPAKNN